MYSRTARTALTLAIVLPIVGIGAVLVYVDSISPDVHPTVMAAAPSTNPEPPEEVVESATFAEPSDEAPYVNPLQPVGPKASTRVTTPSSGSCSSGSCTTPSAPRSGCSSSSSCGS